MPIRSAAIAIASSVIALAAVTPARAAPTAVAQTAGYRFDAEHVSTGVRWGYASLYLMPISTAALDDCIWIRTPTAYGLRFRPDCPADRK